MSAYSKGVGIVPAATRPEIWAMSASKIAPMLSVASDAQKRQKKQKIEKEQSFQGADDGDERKNRCLHLSQIALTRL
jgi:hypothetical protein